MHALCRRMLGNDADALDATQDALLAAIRALDRFDGRSAFGTWLYRIATNVCIDELRRRRRRPVTGLDHDAGDDSSDFGGSGHRTRGGAAAAVGGSGGHDPADVAVARGDVDVALRSLPLEFRTAVVLRDVGDLPYEEIAEILGVPVGTVRSRIARGRSALAALWGSGDQANRTASAREAPGNPEGAPNVITESANEEELTS